MGQIQGFVCSREDKGAHIGRVVGGHKMWTILQKLVDRVYCNDLQLSYFNRKLKNHIMKQLRYHALAIFDSFHLPERGLNI